MFLSFSFFAPTKILLRKRTEHFERDQLVTHISGELPLAGSPVAMCIRARRRGRLYRWTWLPDYVG